MYLEALEGFWRYLQVSKGIWSYLNSEGILIYLKVSESICMYLLYLEGTTCWMHQSFSAIGIRLFGMMPPTMINGSIGCLVLWTESIQKVNSNMCSRYNQWCIYLLLFVLRYNTESSAEKCRWFLSKISCAYWHSDWLTTGGATGKTVWLEGSGTGGFFMIDFLAMGGPPPEDDILLLEVPSPAPVKIISS